MAVYVPRNLSKPMVYHFGTPDESNWSLVDHTVYLYSLRAKFQNRMQVMGFLLLLMSFVGVGFHSGQRVLHRAGWI